MDASAFGNKLVSIEAVVYPPCECGEAYERHGTCGGYRPSRPILNYGTVHFRSEDWLANALFVVERFFQRLRVARLRRK